MIFSKKRQKDQQQLQEAIEHSNTLISDLSARFQSESQNTKSALDALQQAVVQTTQSIRKHDMSLEDMLDALDEQQTKEDSKDHYIKDLEASEINLLMLFCDYQELFWNLKACVSDQKTPWGSQLALSEATLKNSFTSCGIISICDIGDTVDYNKHEVIEVIHDSDISRDLTVAQIYSPGCIYKGRVIKKARIAAYRCRPIN